MIAHPATELFPIMGEAELAELAKDIAEHGQQVPIVTYEGKILDGRNRWRACEIAGVTPKTQEWQGKGSPTEWVISLNLHRRHLTEGQKAAIAVAALPLFEKEAKDRLRATAARTNALLDRKYDETVAQRFEQPSRSAEHAAEQFQVNRQYIYDAKKLSQEAPDLFEQVKTGERTIPNARRELAKRQPKPELPRTPNKYRVIYADPPWKYGDSREGVEQYGPAERHYRTMSIDELCALSVQPLAEDNAVLFLWVTSPMLEVSFHVIRAWGFQYKTSFVWDKVKHNYGHYNSVRHELLLICTRGSCLPECSDLHDSVIEIERSNTHSQKPAEFRELIEHMYPSGQKLELFERGEAAPGWDTFGDQARQYRAA